MLWINIIFWVAYAMLWAAVVRYDVHMFQHNSYREDRYARWFGSGHKFGRAAVIAALTNMGLFSNPIIWGLSVITMAVIAWREFRTVYKKPIVYTMRVKRLFLTAALLTAAAVGVALIFIPKYTHMVALALLIMPVVMLAANLANKPLEAAISRWYYNDAKRILRSMPDLKIIGVTGSFGKTSTKHYLYRILSERYNVLMTPGNFNTTLGVIRTVREQLKPHHQIFIVEMGAKQVGDIKEICDLVHPTIGVVTAVGEMHLETFGSLENVRRTKFELIDALPADGLAIVNMESEAIATAERPSHCRVIGYGVNRPKAEWSAENIDYSPTQTSFEVKAEGYAEQVYTTHLAGRGNILNLLAAIAVADYFHIPQALQKRAIRQIEQIEHRLSIKRTAGGITIIDDAYNSNPAGAKMALEVLRDFQRVEGARRIVVTPGFVEMGQSQYRNNKQLGADIASAADIAIVVNRVNRDAIAEGLRESGFNEDNIILADSFAEASAYLAKSMRMGDIVLYENDLPDSFK
ncbi:MAG: UDP-N-acetylmuramoyl-tripeptide--D-alanyl-D-alanine ligase [Alistipes sp.]|nr:UDP-N-acetylmuramoyl-tripeptide--D-alanyl-D-alanine ligase [Alistipes sp.]